MNNRGTRRHKTRCQEDKGWGGNREREGNLSGQEAGAAGSGGDLEAGTKRILEPKGTTTGTRREAEGPT